MTVTSTSLKSSNSKNNYEISIREDTDVSDLEYTPGFPKQDLPKKLQWKIDLMIMPFFMAIYFLQFLDKTLLNYAALMGIKKNLKGNEFSNLGTMFYVAYLVTEPIAAYLIQKLTVSKFLGAIITLWGIVLACHSLTNTYASLMVVRVLLGICESGAPACLIIISGKWWTRQEQTRRTFFWYTQIGIATIVGCLLSFGFQHVESTKIESWQIMFIFMGIITFIVGILTFIFLPDTPLSCKYLNEEEKTLIMNHIKENQTGFENREYKFYQVKEMLFEKETWILFFINIFSLIDSGALSFFSSQLMKSFGFSNTKSALVQIPLGFVAIISTFLCCYLTSYTGEFSLMIAIVTISSILGAGLYTGLPDSNKIGKLFGIYLMNFNSAVIALLYSWNTSNTSGYTKRNARNAMTLIAFCIGNLVGPQLFQTDTAPKYIPAKIVLLVVLSATCLLAIILRVIVYRENKRRDTFSETLSEEEKHRDVLMLDLTDRENLNFRYIY